MFQFFCCRSRHSSRVEVDEVTDSLEKCLSMERGIQQFKSFLEKNRFEEESKTLEFVLKCQNILTETARVSPSSRTLDLPYRIHNDIRSLVEMADDINFDLDQMKKLRSLYSSDVEEKMETLQMAQSWATDLLQDIYKTFRARALRDV